MVATFPGTRYGPIHYRHLAAVKQQALRVHRGNYEKFTSSTPLATEDITWWINNLPADFKPIQFETPSISLFTDASNTCWGARLEENETHGNRSLEESELHINIKQIMAVLFGLKTIASAIYNTNIKLNIDNTAVVYVIKHMGTSHNWELNLYVHLI